MNGKSGSGRWVRLGLVVLGAVALPVVLVLAVRRGGRGSAVEPSPDSRDPLVHIEGAARSEDGTPDLAVPRHVSLETEPSIEVEVSPAQDVWRLKGVVEDEAGVPVQGAEVVLNSAPRDPRVSDESGEFIFEASDFNVFAQLRALLTTHAGYAPSRTEVRLPQGFWSRREFVVRVRLSRGLAVTIQVIDEAGAPVVDARVRMRRVVDAAVRSPTTWLTNAEWERALQRASLSSPGTTGAATDEAGIARLNVEPGRYALTGWKPGFSCRGDEATLREVSGDGQSFTYRLEWGAELHGIVQNPEGEPVSGATVYSRVFSKSSGRSWGVGKSREDGSFEITGLPIDAGNVLLIAGHVDFATIVQRGNDPTADFVLTLDRGRELRCTLVDASTDLAVRDGLVVKLEFEARELNVAELARAQLPELAVVQRGAIRIEHIPAFVGGVDLEVPGYAPGRVDCAGTTEGAILKELLLNPLRQQSIIVIDGETGERVDGAEVVLWTAELEVDGSARKTSRRNLPVRVTSGGVEFLVADHLLPHEGECSIHVSGPAHRTVALPFQRARRDWLEPWVVELARQE